MYPIVQEEIHGFVSSGRWTVDEFLQQHPKQTKWYLIKQEERVTFGAHLERTLIAGRVQGLVAGVIAGTIMTLLTLLLVG